MSQQRQPAAGLVAEYVIRCREDRVPRRLWLGLPVVTGDLPRPLHDAVSLEELAAHPTICHQLSVATWVGQRLAAALVANPEAAARIVQLQLMDDWLWLLPHNGQTPRSLVSLVIQAFEVACPGRPPVLLEELVEGDSSPPLSVPHQLRA